MYDTVRTRVPGTVQPYRTQGFVLLIL